MKFENFSEILRLFEQIEHDFDLPNWTIKGVYVWKLVRFSVFRDIRLIHGGGREPHPELNRLKRNKWDHLVKFPIEFLRYNPFLYSRKSVDRAVIASSRKHKIEDEWIDNISLRAWSGARMSTSLVLDQVSPINPVRTRALPDASVLNRLGWAAGKMLKVRLSPRDLCLIRGIQDKIDAPLKKNNRSFECRIIAAVKYFLGLESVYRNLFLMKKPKALYLVCGYGNEAPVSAAKKLGIITAEFQHGSMERGHLGYDYFGWENVPYFSDYLLSWGPKWYEHTFLPKACSPIDIGVPQIDLQYAVKEAKKPKKILVVLSQAPFAEDLMEIISDFLKKRLDWLVRIRPHPSENPLTWAQYLETNAASQSRRLEIESGGALSASARLADVVLGVNSTALVESLLYGCKVVLVRLPNAAPYFQGLVDAGDAVAVRNGSELSACIDYLPKGNPQGYFSAPVEDVCELVESVC
jgi:hypothetical protein